MTTQQYKLTPFIRWRNYFTCLIFILESDRWKFFHEENFLVYSMPISLQIFIHLFNITGLQCCFYAIVCYLYLFAIVFGCCLLLSSSFLQCVGPGQAFISSIGVVTVCFLVRPEGRNIREEKKWEEDTPWTPSQSKIASVILHKTIL